MTAVFREYEPGRKKKVIFEAVAGQARERNAMLHGKKITHGG